jgi:mevalonate kinase
MDFHSHGKLLITGEYLVLRGATALAVPVKFGQKMLVQENPNDENLGWESFEMDISWFRAQIDTSSFRTIETNNQEVAHRLLKLLKAANHLNQEFLRKQRFKKVSIKADFNLSWGLGSSSTLISNVAWWAGVDPFSLHKLVSNGSGYDVICARAEGPVFFTLQGENDYKIEKSGFSPIFADQIYFIYLGKKQDSSLSVEAFVCETKGMEKESERVSFLTNQLSSVENISAFEACMKEHEEIISSILRRKRIKEERFADLNGEVKSLGAWGGDFAMITWHDTKEELKKYLSTRNIDTIFTFNEMIKQR